MAARSGPAKAPLHISLVLLIALLAGCRAGTEGPPIAPADRPEASAESGTTPAPQAEGPSWKFHAVTLDGWEYDVEIKVPVSFELTKYIDDSPPGKARLQITKAGEIITEFTPTLRDRNAPPMRPGVLSPGYALYGVDTVKGANEYEHIDPNFGEAPCDTGDQFVSEATGVPTSELRCKINLAEGTHFTGDLSEDFVDVLVSQYGDKGPDAYLLSFSVDGGRGCEVLLKSDGEVGPVERSRCAITSISG